MVFQKLFLSLIFLIVLAAFTSKAPSVGDPVWVSKSDGAMSCAQGSGEGLEKGKSILDQAGIQVLESRKGSDGKARIAMCGVAQGSLNMYKIPREKAADAQKLGFNLVLEGAR